MGPGRLTALLCLLCPVALPAQDVSDQRLPSTFRWGLQRPDLIRYNRVEGLSVGARLQIRPQTLLGPITVTAIARLGTADVEPNGRLDFTRETLERRVGFSAFHELASIDERSRHMGIGNSVLAAFAGRDDGDYFRRSGAWFEWSPPTADRRDARVRAFAEYHRPVGVETDVAAWGLLQDDFSFRDNLAADEGWLYGGIIEVSPSWGTDPNLAQGRVVLTLESATGDYEYARAAALARVEVPVSADMRLGLEAGGGTSWGEPPAQRMWYLGGPRTLRGFDPRALVGQSFGRARGELARTFSFGAVSLFSDAGWAGVRDDIDLDDALLSAGVGLSLIDGLIHFDAAWGLRGSDRFRFDVYLEAIL